MYHVLYVDDEPDLLEIAKLYLGVSNEFIIDTAGSAQEMLKGQDLSAYDAIISDYRMPDMDGITFLKEVRTRFGTIPFILFTGRGREEVVIEAINNGVDIYLQKGGDPRSLFAELVQKIRIVVERHRAEDALRENRRTLVTLMDNLQGMAYRCRNDPDWTMEFVSGGGKLLTGYEPEELVGNRIVSFGGLILPEDQQRIWMQIQTCIDRDQPFQIEYRIKDRSGQVKWVWEQGRGVFNDHGKLLALEGYITDITRRREAEDELHRINERNKALLLANPDLMFVYSADGRIIDFHAGDFRVLYASPDQFLGRLISEVLPPAVARTVCGHIAHIAETGIPQRYEYSLNVDGRIRYFESRLVRSGDREFLSIVREITEQRDAEEAVQESEERYRAAISEMQDLFYRTDLEGIIQMLCPAGARLIGYASPEDLVGQTNIREIYADPKEREAFLAQLAEEGEVTDYPLTLKALDGSHRQVVASSHFYYGADGTVLGVEGVLHDITEEGLSQRPPAHAEEALLTQKRLLQSRAQTTRSRHS